MKKILHITEAFGGGVQTALYSYLQSSRAEPYQHFLFARARQEDMTREGGEDGFSHVQWSQGNVLQFMMDANKFIDQVQPDIVHLHSSKAGFLGRFLRLGKAQLVYTPHCYSFERKDITPLERAVYRTLEKLMIRRIDVVAGCSQRECDLALQLGAKKSELLNNFVTYTDIATSPSIDTDTVKITILGRVAPQKDPQFLIDTLTELKHLPVARKYIINWIGGGDNELEAALKKCGINVTGMLPRDEVMIRLKESDLYLHTAAWEGMPLTILEASKLHVPMVIRSIGATENLNYPFLAKTSVEMAKQIAHCINNYDEIDFKRYSQEVNHSFSENNQRLALVNIYG